MGIGEVSTEEGGRLMESAAFLLFNLIICAVEGYLYYSFCEHFLQNRYETDWINAGIVAAGMLVLFGINQFHSSGLNLFASSFICITLSFILFKDYVRKKIYIWFVSWFIMICCEFVVSGILLLTWGTDTIMVEGNPARVLLATVMMKFITLFVYRLICNSEKEIISSQYPAYVFLFFCLPVASFIVCLALCYLGDSLVELSTNDLLLMLGCVLLLVANVVAFVIYDRLILIMNRVKRYEIMEMKQQLEDIHYKSVNEMNEKVKTILHNMNGVMRTLDVLMQSKEAVEIKNVILGLQEQLREAGQTVYCGHPLIDAILKEKSRTAYEENIAYSVFVEPGFTMIEMKSMDLISVIGNLIDNALEAAAQCKDGYINIKMFQANDGAVAIMKVENNYAKNPIEYNGVFQTRKENAAMHGIGLKYVQKLVAQYNGYINIVYNEKMFEVTTSFNK